MGMNKLMIAQVAYTKPSEEDGTFNRVKDQ
jgi:hypothetical protein